MTKLNGSWCENYDARCSSSGYVYGAAYAGEVPVGPRKIIDGLTIRESNLIF